MLIFFHVYRQYPHWTLASQMAQKVAFNVFLWCTSHQAMEKSKHYIQLGKCEQGLAYHMSTAIPFVDASRERALTGQGPICFRFQVHSVWMSLKSDSETHTKTLVAISGLTTLYLPSTISITYSPLHPYKWHHYSFLLPGERKYRASSNRNGQKIGN